MKEILREKYCFIVHPLWMVFLFFSADTEQFLAESDNMG